MWVYIEKIGFKRVRQKDIRLEFDIWSCFICSMLNLGSVGVVYINEDIFSRDKACKKLISVFVC